MLLARTGKSLEFKRHNGAGACACSAAHQCAGVAPSLRAMIGRSEAPRILPGMKVAALSTQLLPDLTVRIPRWSALAPTEGPTSDLGDAAPAAVTEQRLVRHTLTLEVRQDELVIVVTVAHGPSLGPARLRPTRAVTPPMACSSTVRRTRYYTEIFRTPWWSYTELPPNRPPLLHYADFFPYNAPKDLGGDPLPTAVLIIS